MKIFLVCIVLISAGLYQNSLGCVLAGKSLSKFDESEYVFIGKVVGLTKPVAFDETRANDSVAPLSYTNTDRSKKEPREAVGLIVKVIESVYLPKTPVAYFEIFPYDLMADCSIGGKSAGDLNRLFPNGLEIRVIAKESEFVPGAAGNGVIRLEVRSSEPNSIITNIDQKDRRMTLSSSVFSYKDYKYNANSDSDSKYLLPGFEIRKDLLRLKNSKGQSERNTILDRLFHAPPHAELELKDLFDNYAANQAEADRYFESHLKSTSPETYEQYKIYRQTLDELIRRGFEKKSAEEAIGKALSEGANFETAALVIKSIEILEASKNQPKH